jgi:hypothetical protein
VRLPQSLKNAFFENFSEADFGGNGQVQGKFEHFYEKGSTKLARDLPATCPRLPPLLPATCPGLAPSPASMQNSARARSARRTALCAVTAA